MDEVNFKRVPMWGWIIAAGVGIYIFYTRKNASSTATPQDTSGTSTGNNAPIEILSNDGTSTASVPQYQTNEQWATAAINWLIAQGYDPGLANSAITKGIAGGQDLSGNGMSASEYSLWSLALQHMGSPPQPVSVSPPTSTPGPITGGNSGTPPPVNPPPPHTKSIRYVTVQPWPKKNSSLWSIAQTYYHDGNKWPEIFNANRKGRTRADGTPGVISNANLIYPGEKLIVP